MTSSATKSVPASGLGLRPAGAHPVMGAVDRGKIKENPCGEGLVTLPVGARLTNVLDPR